MPPAARRQRNNAASHGGGGQRGRRPRAARSAGRGQASRSGDLFTNDHEEPEDEVEEMGSSNGPPVSQGSRAFWSDENSACLLQLCLEQ
jgi:hypothetical protein